MSADERPVDPENAALLAELLDQAAALSPPGRTLDEVLAAAQTDDETDEAAVARAREIDEVLARGPRDVVMLALDALDQALYAQQENAEVRSRVDALDRRMGKIDRTLAAVARAIDAQHAANVALLDLLVDGRETA